MKREKGLAYCGLVCALCGEGDNCPGCRLDGCAERDRCKNYRCCREKGLSGCWECGDFPCDGSMLDKVRIRAFARFVRDYGEETLLDALAVGEASGMQYHYPGQIVGDYDVPRDEDGVLQLLREKAGTLVTNGCKKEKA